MPTTDKGALREKVLQFLQKHKTAVIATSSGSGAPEAATITYLFDDDFNFYFITRRQSRKLQNILKNPKVSIVVGTHSDAFETAQIEGTATVIENPDRFVVSYLTKTIKLDEPQWWPLFKIRGADYVFVHVKAEWLRWLDLDRTGYPEKYDENFEQVIP